MTDPLIEIPARRGKAAFVAAGQVITVINTHGEQVVDTWAFNRADLGEFMSNEHTRAHNLHLVPRPGDVLRTNKRRPILTLTEDTSGGIHDTLIAACDRYRYAFLGVESYHDNCTDNLFAGMRELGLESPPAPAVAHDDDLALDADSAPLELPIIIRRAVIHVDQLAADVPIRPVDVVGRQCSIRAGGVVRG